MKVEQKITISRLAVQASFFSFLIVITINLWQKDAPGVVYFLYLLPLMILVPGIIRGEIRTLIWLGFVLLLYFAVAVGRMSNPGPLILDIAELVLVVVLFIVATGNARLRQKNAP